MECKELIKIRKIFKTKNASISVILKDTAILIAPIPTKGDSSYGPGLGICRLIRAGGILLYPFGRLASIGEIGESETLSRLNVASG